ncbi:Ig-like domain-containing protein, partial [Pseudomonas nitroreducens]|uniref:Ig-like domain-containing protein n=1 Tax=Pseudomonas nitroreducens TaxID=46680 RepID=UPI0038223257
STALAEGPHSIKAESKDLAGNTSDSSLFKFSIDITPPAKPTIGEVIDDVGAIQGPIANHGVTDDPTPTLTGEAEAGSKVVIYDNGAVLGSVIAGADGKWSYTPTTGISEGEHNFTTDATDKAGNTSPKSDVFTITTDYTPPDASKLAITGVLDNVGDVTGNIGNGGLTDDSRPVISGTGTAGDTITVFAKDSTGNHQVGTAIVDANGKWSMQPTAALVSGLNDLTAVESDPAGNATDPSAKYSITLDASTPSNLATIIGITDDTGISDHDFITRDQTLAISGKVDTALSAGEKVQFSADGGLTWKDATLNSDRLHWSYDNTAVTLASGTYLFEARVVSQTGIAGAVTTQQVIIDISGPSNTTTIDLDPSSDWGDYNDDNITGDSTPTINGKVTAGSDAFDKLTVTLFDDKNNDGKLGAGDSVFVSGVKVNADGTWTVDLPSLKDGTYKLKAVVVDEAGNVQTPDAGKLIGAHGGTDDLVINSNMRSSLVGEKPGDNAGWLITNVGDFNGDGIDDFFVTAPNAGNDLGRSYLIYGAAGGLPNLGNLGALRPDQGLIITNTDTRFTQEGMVASALADFNGDGYADIAVGSHYQDSMYVLFGGPNGSYTNGTLDLKSINDGDNSHGFMISTRNPVTGHGADSWMFFGSAGGDIDGDGYTDLIFSNWGGYTNGSAGWKQGSVQVIYGGATLADGKPWQNIYMKYVGTDNKYPDTFVPTTDLAKETVTSDVRTTTFALAAGDKPAMGLYMGTVGDINGDGIEDMFFEGNDGTTSYLVYGKAGGFDTTMDLAKFRDGIDGVRFVTADNNMLVDRWYGYHPVARLGDINGDGVDDFAFGMPNAGIDRTVVIYGKKGGLDVTQPIGLANSATGAVPAGSRALTSADGFTILNDKSTTSKWVDANEWFGAGIIGGGDVNGDGIADFIIGAPKVTANGKSECGAIYVIYGREENFTNGVPAISITDLISDPSKGYVLYGQTAGEHLGQSVAMGDWNGDGIIDIAGSAPTSNAFGTNPDGSVDKTHGGNTSGAAYIYYSKADFTKMYTTGDDVIIADGKGLDGQAVDHNLILGGAGNDTILNIGKGDFANGGSGNDTIHVVSLDFRAVDGGTGTDTLVLDGSGLNLNLGAMQARVMNFEKFDLGSGGNSMTVKLDDVLRMGETDMVFKDGKKQMVIDGQNGSVDLTKTGITWTESTASSDGHSYKVYSYGSAELLIEDKVQVHLVG